MRLAVRMGMEQGFDAVIILESCWESLDLVNLVGRRRASQLHVTGCHQDLWQDEVFFVKHVQTFLLLMLDFMMVGEQEDV